MIILYKKIILVYIISILYAPDLCGLWWAGVLQSLFQIVPSVSLKRVAVCMLTDSLAGSCHGVLVQVKRVPILHLFNGFVWEDVRERTQVAINLFCSTLEVPLSACTAALKPYKYTMENDGLFMMVYANYQYCYIFLIFLNVHIHYYTLYIISKLFLLLLFITFILLSYVTYTLPDKSFWTVRFWMF